MAPRRARGGRVERGTGRGRNVRVAYGIVPRSPAYWANGREEEPGATERRQPGCRRENRGRDHTRLEARLREVPGRGGRVFRPLAGYVRRGPTAGEAADGDRLAEAGEKVPHPGPHGSRPGSGRRVRPGSRPPRAPLTLVASYLDYSLVGEITVSGEPFDPEGYTAAHRTLPLGTRLLVSYGGERSGSPSTTAAPTQPSSTSPWRRRAI